MSLLSQIQLHRKIPESWKRHSGMERTSRVVLNQRVQPIPKRDRAASGESSVVGEGLAELHFDFLIFSRAIFISNFLVYTLHIFSVNVFSALASFVTPERSEHESNP